MNPVTLLMKALAPILFLGGVLCALVLVAMFFEAIGPILFIVLAMAGGAALFHWLGSFNSPGE